MSPIIVFLLSLTSMAFAISAPPADVKDEAPAVALSEPETAVTAEEPAAVDEEPEEKEEPATVAVTEPVAVEPLEITPMPAMPTAAGNCQHNQPPACAVEAGGFADNDLATACRTELQDYIANIREYSDCRRDALREIGDLTRNDMTTVQDAARRTTQLFNCRLRGDANCN